MGAWNKPLPRPTPLSHLGHLAGGDLCQALMAAVTNAFPVPAQCPTMPCLGGADLRTLFVTSARDGRPADELAHKPESGCVFGRRVEVAGLPVAFFEE